MNQRSRENRNCETKLRWYQLTTERVAEETRAEALNPHNTLTVQANTDPRNTNRNSESPETTTDTELNKTVKNVIKKT